MSIHWRLSFCTAMNAVPQPQKASRIMPDRLEGDIILVFIKFAAAGARLRY